MSALQAGDVLEQNATTHVVPYAFGWGKHLREANR